MLFDLNFEIRFEILSSSLAYSLFVNNFKFGFVHYNFKNFKCTYYTVRSIFFDVEIFDVSFGISVLKDIKVDGVAIALPKKMVITTQPAVTGTNLK